MMPNKCVIIGDIKKSRMLDNWKQVFEELNKVLDEINRKFSKDIIIEFKHPI